MGYFNFQNNITPANDTNLNAMQKGLMELVFPVGSTYTTPENTNPNTILGFGTWERFKGLIALGLDEDDENLNEIGKTGGEKTHKLTTSELPLKIDGQRNSDTGSDWTKQGVMDNSSVTPHNNMQPYEVVGYMWIRRS